MNKTLYTVYWMDQKSNEPKSHRSSDLGYVLQTMEQLRRSPMLYGSIAMCAENTDQVGAAGVDSIVDGKTPQGEEYTWSKEHRAGAERGVPHSIIDNKSNRP
jgi:hypothetical protein